MRHIGSEGWREISKFEITRGRAGAYPNSNALLHSIEKHFFAINFQWRTSFFPWFYLRKEKKKSIKKNSLRIRVSRSGNDGHFQCGALWCLTLLWMKKWVNSWVPSWLLNCTCRESKLGVHGVSSKFESSLTYPVDMLLRTIYFVLRCRPKGDEAGLDEGLKIKEWFILFSFPFKIFLVSSVFLCFYRNIYFMHLRHS